MKVIIMMFLFSPLAALAQLELTASLGYGSFSMRDMKTFQRQLQKDFPVNAQITSDFPPFWSFEMSGLSWDESLVTGAAVNYTSTGGRIYYSDYSGMLSIDQLLSSVGIDAIAGTRVGAEREKLVMLAQLRGGIVMSQLDLKVKEAVGAQRQSEELTFKSLSGTVQPTFAITRRFNWLGLQALAGYQITVFSGKLYHADIDDSWLQTSDEKPLKADWSGLRVSLGLTIYIF